jgi:MFS family permease
MVSKNPLVMLRKIPTTVWALGLVTLLMNGSNIIIFTMTPFYLTNVLGVQSLALGLIEGVVEGASWVTRMCIGVISDYLHKRKPILVAAYSLSALSKLAFPGLPSVEGIAGARLVDRISNGLQATPREALVGDTAPPALKGACYGLRQTMAWTGSFLGALFLVYLLRETPDGYRIAFICAAIPPVIAVLVAIFVVSDRPVPKGAVKKRASLRWSDVKMLDKRYWMLIAVAGLFMLANYSGAFMLLQTKKAGLSQCSMPWVMILQNWAALLMALPVGWISDRFGRRQFLAGGFVILIISNFFLAQTYDIRLVLIGVTLWGLQMGITHSLLVTKVADVAPEKIRGTSFGIYYLVSGLAVFTSNLCAGWIGDTMGHEYIFYASSLVAFLALLGLMVQPPQKVRLAQGG